MFPDTKWWRFGYMFVEPLKKTKSRSTAAGFGRVSSRGVERCLTLCEEPEGPCFETPYSSQARPSERVQEVF